MNWREYKKRLLEDPKVKKEYDALEDWYQNERRKLKHRMAKTNAINSR